MTPSHSLGRVLAAFAGAEAAAEWLDARGAIRAERERIDAALDAGTLGAVYGFTTMLGQLDRHDRTGAGQGERELLDAHLLGLASPATAGFLRIVSACKLEQLHHGGSGIRPELYGAVILSLSASGTAQGAWHASYGSGDVVPAAWWAQSVLRGSHAPELRRGDTITMINGHFYSSAVSILATLGMIAASARALSLLSSVATMRRSPSLRARPAGVEGLWPLFARDGDRDRETERQRPVSLRDIDPVVSTVEVVVHHLGTALDARLCSVSANPRFHTIGGVVEVESQSSFLDPVLTLALSNAQQAVHLLIGVVQRVIEDLSSARQSARLPLQGLVQPPKVANALLEAAQRLAVLPTRFTGADSSGIEDLRDLSLLTAETLVTLTRLLEQATALADGVGGTVDSALEHRIRDGLLEQLLGAPCADPTRLWRAAGDAQPAG